MLSAHGQHQIRQLTNRRFIFLVLPLYAFILSFWMARPLTLGANIGASAVLTGTFVIGFLALSQSRSAFLELASRLRVEFTLLVIMTTLTILSLLNADTPFRAFRILFPCLLPLLLFCQMGAIRIHAPQAFARIPRLFLGLGLFFALTLLALSFVSGGIKTYVFADHRYVGFFENANQHSIVLAALIPLAIMEVSVASKGRRQLLWSLLLFALIYAILRTGSKTALLVSLSAGWLFYLLVNIRSYGPLQRIALIGVMVAAALGIKLFGLQIVAQVDPIVAKKLEMIFSEGATNYYSIKSRQALWAESIEQGTRHWLIGSGAGQKLKASPNSSHSHNLVLEYFRGIGIFGATCIILLCLTILWRGLRKTIEVLSGADSIENKRVWACYAAAAFYVVCNQLSDSFGPTTIPTLWIIYLPAVLSDPSLARGRGPLPFWKRSSAIPTSLKPRWTNQPPLSS